MILTDREIKNSLASGLILIDPLPSADAYASTTVDLTLDPTLRLFKKTAPGLSVAIDPGLPGYKAKDLLAAVTRHSGGLLTGKLCCMTPMPSLGRARNNLLKSHRGVEFDSPVNPTPNSGSPFDARWYAGTNGVLQRTDPAGTGLCRNTVINVR